MSARIESVRKDVFTIRNGTAVLEDRAIPADVVVEDGRISGIVPGRLPAGAFGDAPSIDAEGCLVTPGFIDVHAHSDTYLLIEPDAPSKISQGITTEINGNCGGSCAPRFGEARLSGDWSSMTYPLPGGGTASGPGPTWRSLAEYRELFDETRPAINSVQLTGHNTLRASVMGYAPRRAEPDETAAMCRLFEKCIDEGSSGLSTGLVYQPGKWCGREELASLLETAAKRGKFYTTHMRSEGDRIEEAIDEVLDLAAATGVRTEISHLKTAGRRNWGKIDAVLEKLQKAVDAGLILGSDRYPFCAAGTELDFVFPDWAQAGGAVAELERLRDPVLRARIVEETAASREDLEDIMIGGGWSGLTRPWSGRTLGEAAKALGKSPAETACDFVLADGARTGAFFFSMSEENMRKILSMPWVAPGSDASLRAPYGPLGADHPHPRAYGTMPEFFRIAGENSSGGICETVRRMTSMPAKRFGLKMRGRLEEGCFADIAVWDPRRFANDATYSDPHRFCKGMKAVLVNGVLSYADGRPTGRRAGRFLQAQA